MAQDAYRLQQDAESTCRKIIKDDPNASIDAIARALNARYRGHGLSKGIIQRLRLEERLRIDAGQRGEPNLRILSGNQKHEPFNPPHWGRIDNTCRASIQTNEAIGGRSEGTGEVVDTRSKVPQNPHKPHAPSTHDERRKWFEDWILTHPTAKVKEARQALYDRFGIALGSQQLVDTMKTVRRMVTEDRQRGLVFSPPTTQMMDGMTLKPPTVDDLVKMARFLKVKRLELHNGSYSIIMEG